MSASHALKYHLVIPAAIFVGLLVIGVPIGTAFFVGMMAGCMSMMVMMGASSRGHPRVDQPDQDDHLKR
jgi:hypothetical protein